MYQTLLVCHNFMRWLVLASLLFAIYKAYRGYALKRPFTATDNLLRHSTATIAHVQLVLGMLLYFNSTLIKYFWANYRSAVHDIEFSFFGIFHIAFMFIAVVLITIGSALAKRKSTDSDKFKTMLIWFSFALLIIFMAIPWPFSPFVNRPYLR